MSHGCVARRAILGLVTVLSIPALLAPTAGCQWLSIAPNDSALRSPLPPSSRPATVAAKAGSAPAPGTLVARAPEQTAPTPPSEPVQPRPASVKTSTPTPLLDSALAQAEAREKAEPQSPDAPGATPAEPSLPPKETAKPEPNPLPIPIDLVVLPPLATVPKPDEVSTEMLRVSATAALSQPGEKTAIQPRPINPDRPADRPESWREVLERLRRLARDRAGEPGATAVGWRLRARLLDWLDQTAPESDPGTLWRSVVAALAESETAEETSRAADIRRVVRTLEDRSPLEITDLRLCRKVNGFGSFEPIDPSSCKPGQAVIIYCEMAGLRYEEVGEMFRSRLSSQVEITSSQEGKPVWDQTLGTADDLCRRRRRDYYVCYRINLPENLAPGSYELRLTQQDLVAGRATTLAIPLTIQP